MELLENLANNQVLVSILLLILGGLITWIFTKLTNKTAVFRYFINTNKIGVSADDKVFGTVISTWQGVEMRNLYLSTIEIENSTTKDFDDLNFKVYT